MARRDIDNMLRAGVEASECSGINAGEPVPLNVLPTHIVILLRRRRYEGAGIFHSPNYEVLIGGPRAAEADATQGAGKPE